VGGRGSTSEEAEQKIEEDAEDEQEVLQEQQEQEEGEKGKQQAQKTQKQKQKQKQQQQKPLVGAGAALQHWQRGLDGLHGGTFMGIRAVASPGVRPVIVWFRSDLVSGLQAL
jgi:hypothetical protein